jgi:hypothetical protein
MRSWLALVLLPLAAPGLASAEDAPFAERLAGAAARLDEALTRPERDAASFAFEDDEREDVRYAPFLLDGARHGELREPAASLVDELLAVSLGPRGMERVRQIRRLEEAVARKDAERFVPGFVARRWRDPGRYFVALFGAPSAEAPWGFRYEGHHLSLNLTAVPGAAPASTPLFLGAEPRVVPEGWPGAGVAVLGEEEAAARALLAALPEALRARATLRYDGDRALMLGQVRRVAAGPEGGVARGEVPPEAQARFDALLELFLAGLAPEIAAARRGEIYAAGRDALRFAWSEAADPPGAFYFRLSGPRTLIEMDNTSDGDHVHAVWHDLTGDFGDDLLARHYREAHGLALGSPR